MRKAKLAQQRFPLVTFVSPTIRRLLLPLSVAVGVLAGCDDYSIENQAAEEYIVETHRIAGASASVVRNHNEDVTVVIIQVSDAAACDALYADTIKSFGYMVVFQSLDGEELRAPETAARHIYNPILMTADASPDKWTEYCDQMTTTREQFIGCLLPEDSRFNIGIWTKAHFDQGDFEEMADKAEIFEISQGSAIGLRNDQSRSEECQANAQ